MTYESDQRAKKVKDTITGLANIAHDVKFAEEEMTHAEVTLEAARAKLKREQARYDEHLEKVVELFPHFGTGFKEPEPTQSVALGADGLVHVVESPEAIQDAS